MAEAQKHRPNAGCARAKAEGAFIALAAGDALGWPQEMEGKLIRPKNVSISANFHQWVRRGGGQFFPHEEVIGAGEYSDDTQSMLAVARCRVIPSPKWWTALTRVELPLWTLYERGGGGATKRAAQSWLDGIPPWQNKKKNGAKRYFEAGGNGVAMRIVPHAIFFAGQADASQMIDDVVTDGIATHGHPRALVGAAAYAFAAWWYLRVQKTVAFGEIIDVLLNEVNIWGAPPPPKNLKNGWFDEANTAFNGDYGKAWQSTVSEMQQLLKYVQMGLNEGAIANDNAVLKNLGAFSQSKGAGTISAAATLYLNARYAANPVQGIIKAAFAHGIDTDTISSMTGGLAGCLAGTEWMPRVWFDVQDSEYLRELANRVARGPNGITEHPPDLVPVSAPQLAKLRSALVEGHEGDLGIDGIRTARVTDFPHPRPLSKTTLVRRWLLHVNDGQTLYITKCSRKPKPDLELHANHKVPVAEGKISDATASVGDIKFSVCDLASATSFYNSALGLDPTERNQKFVKFGSLSLVESRHDQKRSAGTRQKNPTPQRSKLEIRVSRLEECLARVEKAGGRIVHRITTTPDGHRVFECLDLDGNGLEIIESPDRQLNMVNERKQGNTGGKTYRVGDKWASAKLDVLAEYLTTYITALKNRPRSEHPFKMGYIDAFAGSNYHEVRCDSSDKQTNQSLLFPNLAKQEPQELLNRSAELALKIEPCFNSYIFIARNAERRAALNALGNRFPSPVSGITIRSGDANREIQDICRKAWHSHHAVLFLDPYGMQVEWTTVEAVAKTQAIDIWLLFPLGIGVDYLLTKSRDIPESWKRQLDLLLGTEDWYNEFNKIETERPLFYNQQKNVITAKTEIIGRYFNNRLKKIFAGVVDKPGVLRDSSNRPLYLLCFAAGNKHSKRIALRTAEDLLKKID